MNEFERKIFASDFGSYVAEIPDPEDSDVKKYDYVSSKSKYSLELIQYDMVRLKSREYKYQELLERYVDDYKFRKNKNRRYRSWFFWTFLITFILILLVSMLYILVTAFYADKFDISVVTGLITVCLTMISSIIIIPKIIAKYLFDADEDKYMAEIIKAMFLQDNNTRNNIEMNHNDEENLL